MFGSASLRGRGAAPSRTRNPEMPRSDSAALPGKSGAAAGGAEGVAEPRARTRRAGHSDAGPSGPAMLAVPVCPVRARKSHSRWREACGRPS